MRSRTFFVSVGLSGRLEIVLSFIATADVSEVEAESPLQERLCGPRDVLQQMPVMQSAS
jgi:hypothetical protein